MWQKRYKYYDKIFILIKLNFKSDVQNLKWTSKNKENGYIVLSDCTFIHSRTFKTVLGDWKLLVHTPIYPYFGVWFFLLVRKSRVTRYDFSICLSSKYFCLIWYIDNNNNIKKSVISLINKYWYRSFDLDIFFPEFQWIFFVLCKNSIFLRIGVSELIDICTTITYSV